MTGLLAVAGRSGRHGRGCNLRRRRSLVMIHQMRRVVLDQVDLQGHDVGELLIANVTAGRCCRGRAGRAGMIVTQMRFESLGALESLWTQRAAFGGCFGWTIRSVRNVLLLLLLMEGEIHDGRMLLLLQHGAAQAVG